MEENYKDGNSSNSKDTIDKEYGNNELVSLLEEAICHNEFILDTKINEQNQMIQVYTKLIYTKQCELEEQLKKIEKKINL